MRGLHIIAITGLAIGLGTPVLDPVQARSSLAYAIARDGRPNGPMAGVLQCVPFARNTSGIRLYGDAHTWWRQAEGRYARGSVPRPGAVMTIRPHGGSSLGHVATVSRIVDARTILISHANWSAPGQIERNVTARDVSPANDWSEVRVWYAPIASLGGGHWPVSGFIYNARPGADLAETSLAEPGRATSSGKSIPRTTLTRVVPSKLAKVRFGNEPHRPEPANKATRPSGPAQAPVSLANARIWRAQAARLRSGRDPIGAIIASSR